MCWRRKNDEEGRGKNEVGFARQWKGEQASSQTRWLWLAAVRTGLDVVGPS